MNKKKGILLAGGLGTRFRPITYSINKHFLPIYKKPMFFYPLSVLMLSGVEEVLIVSDSNSLKIFKKIISKLNLKVKFTYVPQNKPSGIVDGILKCKRHINGDDFMLILGDNFFYAQSLSLQLNELINKNNCVVSVKNKNPSEFGVIQYKNKKIFKIIEKPKKFISNDVITGLYVYENEVIKICEKLNPSKRGELEITDLNNELIRKNKLEIMELGRGSVWLDAGSPDDLLGASEFVKIIENRSGFEIANLHEINKNSY
tara:strand:- start:24 stop:800 length:777 start_codon:yes stop_codon:yes gene_type:complete